MHISELTHYIPTKKCLSYHAKKCDGLTDGLGVNLSSPDSQFKNKKTKKKQHVQVITLIVWLSCTLHAVNTENCYTFFSYVI